MNKGQLKKLSVLFEQEKWEELEKLSRSLIKSNKKDGVAWKALGTALEGQDKDALQAMQMAVKLLPTDAQAYFNLGNCLKWHDKKQESVVYYRRALELKPDYAEAWSNLGNALHSVGEPMEALKCYWTGIRLAPHLVNIQLNMGNCYAAMGEHDRAIRMYKMSLEIKPDFIEAANSIIFAKDLMSMQTLDGALADRRMWNERFAAPLLEDKPFFNDRDPERGLRIGYVSADFREHSACRSFGAIIKYHDRAQFELYAYHTTRRPDDHYTKMVRANVDHWRRITDDTEQAFADQVRRDRIDILVDLSGHSGGNRLQGFARKPAPIQCTGWGYATGTGMDAMDFLIADKVTVPEDEQRFYAEEICYLPCIDGPYWVETFPDVSELPALHDGLITFGSLNRLAKVTKETIALWARVLSAVPHSGLVMKAGEFSEKLPCERMEKAFADLGIASNRLILSGASPWLDHMGAYRNIDIALDTVPQGGGVTTLEGMMMGVPVVTLRWPTIPGRVSSSILTRMGLTDWIAETEDQYVSLAVEKAKDLQKLAALRQTIRPTFMATVGNGPAYAAELEAQYRAMWRRWCATGSPRTKLVDKEFAAA